MSAEHALILPPELGAPAAALVDGVLKVAQECREADRPSFIMEPVVKADRSFADLQQQFLEDSSTLSVPEQIAVISGATILYRWASMGHDRRGRRGLPGPDTFSGIYEDVRERLEALDTYLRQPDNPVISWNSDNDRHILFSAKTTGAGLAIAEAYWRDPESDHPILVGAHAVIDMRSLDERSVDVFPSPDDGMQMAEREQRILQVNVDRMRRLSESMVPISYPDGNTLGGPGLYWVQQDGLLLGREAIYDRVWTQVMFGKTQRERHLFVYPDSVIGNLVGMLDRKFGPSLDLKAYVHQQLQQQQRQESDEILVKREKAITSAADRAVAMLLDGLLGPESLTALLPEEDFYLVGFTVEDLLARVANIVNDVLPGRLTELVSALQKDSG